MCGLQCVGIRQRMTAGLTVISLKLKPRKSFWLSENAARINNTFAYQPHAQKSNLSMSDSYMAPIIKLAFCNLCCVYCHNTLMREENTDLRQEQDRLGKFWVCQGNEAKESRTQTVKGTSASACHRKSLSICKYTWGFWPNPSSHKESAAQQKTHLQSYQGNLTFIPAKKIHPAWKRASCICKEFT